MNIEYGGMRGRERNEGRERERDQVMYTQCELSLLHCVHAHITT